MAAVGGSIIEVIINGRIFAVAADAESNRKLGGFENEIQPNGDGSGRPIKNRVAWVLDGLTLSTDDDRGDQEFLQDVADAPGFASMGATFASGSTYSGTGTVTGEFSTSSRSATSAVTLSGPGKLAKQ